MELEKGSQGYVDEEKKVSPRRGKFNPLEFLPFIEVLIQAPGL